MTDRTATVRVNVTGNAASELAKVANAEKTLGTQARGAQAHLRPLSAAVNDIARSSVAAGTGLRKAATDAAQAARTMATLEGAAARAARSTTGLASAFRSLRAGEISKAASDMRTMASSSATAARNIANMRVSMGRGGVGAMASGLGSLGMSALNTARGFGGTLGIPGRDQLVAGRNDVDVRLARLTAQAGMSDVQAAQLRAEMNQTARGSGMNPAEILALYETGQNRFSDLPSFRQNAASIARAARGTGADANDIGAAIGEFQRQLGVGAGDVDSLIGIMTAGASKGSVEASDIAGEFSSSIGTYQRVTGESGLAGARNMLGLAQVLGASGTGGAGTAVLTQNLLSKMSQTDVLRGFQRAGVNTHQDGQFVGFDALAQQMLSNRRFVGEDGQINAGAIQGILGSDMQANQALGVLLSEARKGNTVGSIAGVSADEGNAMIADANRRIDQSAGGAAMNAAASAAVNFDQNGEALVRTMTSMASAAANLDTKFPLLSTAVDATAGAFGDLRNAMAQIGMVNLANRMTQGGGGGGGGGGNQQGGGGTPQGSSAATHALSGFAGKLAIATAAVGTFQLAARGTLAVLDVAGNHRGAGTASENWSDFWSGNFTTEGVDWGQLNPFGDDRNDNAASGGSAEEIRRRVIANARRTQGGGAAGGGAPGAAADPANTQATDANTQALQQHSQALERNTRAVQSRPATGDTAEAGR